MVDPPEQPTKSKLRREGVLLAHGLRVQSIKEREARQQENAAATHSALQSGSREGQTPHSADSLLFHSAQAQTTDGADRIQVASSLK